MEDDYNEDEEYKTKRNLPYKHKPIIIPSDFSLKMKEELNKPVEEVSVVPDPPKISTYVGNPWLQKVKPWHASS
jgi:hypothetical protein